MKAERYATSLPYTSDVAMPGRSLMSMNAYFLMRLVDV